MSHKNFKSLIELRDFLVKLVNDTKNQELPGLEFYKKSIFKQIAAQGYTKTFSKKAKLFMKNRLFVSTADKRDLYTVAAILPTKRGFSVVAVCLKKISVEDRFYYIGNNPNSKRYFVISPHLFQQYRHRVKNASLDEAIIEFMQTTLLHDFSPIKIPDSITGEILVDLKKGIGLGHLTNLGIQNKEVIFLKTFITTEMQSEEQRLLLEQNKK